MGWQEAIQQDKDSYDRVVNLAREAIKELENRHFIKEGQNVATFLDPPDGIIEDELEDGDDPDRPEVPLLEPISSPQALGAVSTLRTFAEQQKEDYTVFLRQLRALEREMKAFANGKQDPNYPRTLFVAK
jgi:hypothetical protein